MILSWQAGTMALITLVVIGAVTSTYSARRAAELPPVEALRSRCDHGSRNLNPSDTFPLCPLCPLC
jgi:hypothetical protein